MLREVDVGRVLARSAGAEKIGAGRNAESEAA
jgi:hypothetical protein